MNRVCCKYRRGSNDALYDSVDKRSYCGECWQQWVTNNKKRVHTKPVQATTIDTPKPEIESDTEQEQEPQADEVLEGIVHSDGNLYLLDRSKNCVYSSLRDDTGELIEVGTLTSTGSIKLNSPPPILPFATDASDNCETPQEAYKDLAPILRQIACQLKKPPADLIIYDPYYCDGGVKKKLSMLGFNNVHNEPVDFYTTTPPKYDVIVTNPPYSGDHIERMFIWLTKNSTKPWFIALPNYVYTKPYFQQLEISPLPFYLVPSSPRRYVYVTPIGMRQVKSGKRKTAPFVSMWYCWAGELTGCLYRWWTLRRDNDALTLCCTERFLPNEFKDSNDSTRRKKKKSKRNKDEETKGEKTNEIGVDERKRKRDVVDDANGEKVKQKVGSEGGSNGKRKQQNKKRAKRKEERKSEENNANSKDDGIVDNEEKGGRNLEVDTAKGEMTDEDKCEGIEDGGSGTKHRKKNGGETIGNGVKQKHRKKRKRVDNSNKNTTVENKDISEQKKNKLKSKSES